MVLERLPNGEHVYHPPTGTYIPPVDPFSRTAQIGAPSTKPIGPAHYSPPRFFRKKDENGKDLNDGYEYASFFYKIYDIRGTWMQEGTFDVAHCNYSECEFVGDGPGEARHPFAIKDDNATNGEWVVATNVATQLYRMVWAYFAGTMFATMGILDALVQSAQKVYAETTAANPVMAKVTTYAPNAGSFFILCMAVVSTGGTTRLWIGYDVATGAARGVEAFDGATLAAPTQVDVSDGHAGAVSAVSGIIQAPNGDILVATSTGDLRICTNNTAALAALSFANVQTQALGYYPVAIGNCALSNYAPGALWWCGLNDSVAGVSFAGSNLADVTPKGRLVLSTYDGLQLDPIDFPNLPWVTFATVYGGGVCACDREAHYWYTGRRMVPMDGGADRVANSHKTRLCCGHAMVNDKLVIAEVEIDDRFVAAAPVDAYNTTVRFLEFDPYREQMRPVSKKFDLGFGGQSLVVGSAPSIPFSPNTRNVHIFSIFEGLLATRNQDYGQWLRQYQAKPNITGFAERSTDQAAAGAHEFADTPTYTSPLITHPSLDGFEYTPVRLLGPPVSHLLYGGNNAYLAVNCGGYEDSDASPQRLKATEPDEKYPAVQFGTWPNRSWSTALQLEVTSHQATGAIQLTTNMLPLILEVIARRPLPRAVKFA